MRCVTCQQTIKMYRLALGLSRKQRPKGTDLEIQTNEETVKKKKLNSRIRNLFRADFLKQPLSK